MDVVDADTHVIEDERVWTFFDDVAGDLARLRPTLVKVPSSGSGRLQHRWLIDGNLVPKPSTRGTGVGATPPIDGLEPDNPCDLAWSWRNLDDPIGRLEDSQKRGVSFQVVYPTQFLHWITDSPALEVALDRTYNRFMADAWERAERGFGWVVVPPLRDRDATVDELRFGKEHGAVGVLFRGIEGDRSIGDPYFDPVYAAAEQLGLSICIHTGAGCPAITAISDPRYMRNFGQVRMLPLIGFHDLVFSRVPERFPTLRFGFIESAAGWVPFLVTFLRRAAVKQPRLSGRDPATIGPQLFDDYRMYVACEVDEDIPDLARYMGWDHILIGSDYGHTDQSAELDYVNLVCARGDLDEASAERVLADNPARFYGLS